jgi:hypothetical protein
MSAQTPTPPADVLPPAEVGVGVGVLLARPDDSILDDLSRMVTADVRMTLPLTARFALEGIVTMRRDSAEFSHRTLGLYAFQIKQRIARGTSGSVHPFVTYGAAGYYSRISQQEVVSTLPDGRMEVTPAAVYTDTDPPVTTLVGGGLQYEFARRVALRIDGQMLMFPVIIPTGTRLSVGVSQPFGAYRR